MIVIYVIMAVAFITFVIVASTIWESSRYMTISHQHNKTWGYATFSTFLKEYNKSVYNWSIWKHFKNSLFSKDSRGEVYHNGYIHAGIIRFGDKGMVLYPLSYLRFLWWKKKEIKRINMEENEPIPRYEPW